MIELDNKIEGGGKRLIASPRSAPFRAAGESDIYPWIETFEGPSKTYQFLAPHAGEIDSLNTRFFSSRATILIHSGEGRSFVQGWINEINR